MTSPGRARRELAALVTSAPNIRLDCYRVLSVSSPLRISRATSRVANSCFSHRCLTNLFLKRAHAFAWLIQEIGPATCSRGRNSCFRRARCRAVDVRHQQLEPGTKFRPLHDRVVEETAAETKKAA